MSHISPEDEPKNIPELLLSQTREYFPIVEGDVKPMCEVPPISMEGLTESLHSQARLRIIGRYASSENFEVEDTQSVYPQKVFPLKRHYADLPQSLLNGDETVFIGPLMLAGEYKPYGFAVWKLLPEEQDKQ
ncbi:hypothetical protein KC950_01260 [Candidatus Saccharibacteria bacterium]|nr:hypothetical protein [Candidatus Saccharibacteria bacterium]